jgi:hypothetical protein
MRVLSASVFGKGFMNAKNGKKLIEIVASNRRKIIGTGLTLVTIASFSPKPSKVTMLSSNLPIKPSWNTSLYPAGLKTVSSTTLKTK